MPEPGRPKLLEQDNYGVALREAVSRLASADLGLQAARAGAQTGLAGLSLRVLGEDVLIRRDPDDPSRAVVRAADPQSPLPIWEQILVLHYLLGAGDRLEGDIAPWVAFRELPDATFYDAAFRQQVCAPLAEAFGERPEALLPLAGRWDAAPGDSGDASLVVPAFPKVRLCVQIWRGDEEFPPEANVLFSRSTARALTAEDAAVLADILASRLRAAAPR